MRRWSIAVGCTAGLIHWPIKKQGSKCHMQGGLVERVEGVEGVEGGGDLQP